MKKTIVFPILFIGLSLAIPQGVFANSVVSIDKDGVTSASEVRVVQLAGRTFFTRLYWGLAFVRVTVKTNANTKFYRGTGELTNLSEIAEGDFLDITGELEANSNTLTIVAGTVKNSSVQKKQTVISGKVVSVDLGQRFFVLDSKKLGVVTISVKPDTNFKKGNRTLNLEHIIIGDTVTKASGDYNLNTKTLIADSVETYVDMSYYKPKNFEGVLEEVVGTTLPTSIKVLIGRTSFLVNLKEKASVLKKNKNLVSLNRFVVGDKVRLYGVIREVDEAIIDADIVRNLNL